MEFDFNESILPDLGDLGDLELSKLPFVSVIIPFYGKTSSSLLQCLRALNQQTYPKSLYEIIVVENNEKPWLTTTELEQFSARLIIELKPGSYSARNTGIRNAKGSVLAFTDSDCIPSENWLLKGVQAIIVNSERQCAVGGNVVLMFDNAEKPNVFELYDKIIHMRQEHYVKNLNFAATANLVSPKHIFDEYGNFNELHFSGGDKEWGQRVSRSGVSLIYSSDAIVFHAARNNWKSVAHKNCRLVGGVYIALKREGAKNMQLLKLEWKASRSRKRLLQNSPYSNSTGLTVHKLLALWIAIFLVRLAESTKILLGGKLQR